MCVGEAVWSISGQSPHARVPPRPWPGCPQPLWRRSGLSPGRSAADGRRGAGCVDEAAVLCGCLREHTAPAVLCWVRGEDKLDSRTGRAVWCLSDPGYLPATLVARWHGVRERSRVNQVVWLGLLPKCETWEEPGVRVWVRVRACVCVCVCGYSVCTGIWETVFLCPARTWEPHQQGLGPQAGDAEFRGQRVSSCSRRTKLWQEALWRLRL